MKGMITALYNEGRIIHVYIRTEDGKRVHRVVDDFYPYFYVRGNGEYRSLFGERLKKIVLNDPKKVPEVRSRYNRHYEADVIFTRRWLIDSDIYLYVDADTLKPVDGCRIKPRVLFVDTELIMDKVDYQNPKGKLICWTAYDSYLGKFITNILADKNKLVRWSEDHYVLYSKNEIDLIVNFLKMLDRFQPDILTGWNVNFDMKVLRNVCRKFKLRYNFRVFDIFNLQAGYKKLFKRKSYRLKDVAVYEGIADEHPMEFEEALEHYLNGNYDVMVSYNYDDVDYCVKIDRNHKLIDWYLTLKEITGLESLSKTLSTGLRVDNILLRIAKKLGVVVPSMGQAKEEEFKAAAVVEPAIGRFKGVAVFDASRYYPSVIMSLNISPETKVVEDGKIRFKDKPKGIFPRICEILLKQRDLIEKKMMKFEPGSEEWDELKMKRDAVKFTANAVFGYAGWKVSRVYDVDVASMIAGVARDGLLHLVDYVRKEFRMPILAGDTDSIILHYNQPFSESILSDMEEISKTLSTELSRYIAEKYDCKNPMFKMKFEKYASMAFFTGVKKRYAMRIVYEGKPCNYVEIKGFESKRSDSSEFTTRFMNKLFELILTEDVSVHEVLRYIEKSVEEFRKAPLEDIAIPKGLNKPLYAYEQETDFVRAAKIASKFLGIHFNVGDKIKMVYTKYVKGIPGCDVIAFHHPGQLPEIGIDWDKMLERSIYNKAVRDIIAILNKIGGGKD